MTRTLGKWWFMPVSAGTTGARGLLDVLQGTHLDGAELFVREVTQNSVDAHSDSGIGVELDFRSESVVPTVGRRLRDFLSSDLAFHEHVAAFEGKARYPKSPSAFDRLGTEHGPRVLYVEDWGTVGLGGRIGGTSGFDHFTRLVYLFGQSHDESGKGGAFGFGKSVLSIASSVRTVIYYSRPAPVNGTSQPSRLIGVSLFPNHVLESSSYTGFALCGAPSGDQAFPIYPIEGDEADELASGFGFAERGPEDYGTSMLVIGCKYDVREVRAAVERWWWPRIVSGGKDRLEVRFQEDGEQLPGADPKGRPDLLPFIEAYERVLDRREPSRTSQIHDVRSVGKQIVGTLSLLALDPPPEETGESWYVNKVATFRGPGLVVEYLDAGKEYLPPVVGVFAASTEMDRIFRRAEPPAHDRWAPESDRLEGREPALVAAVAKQSREYAKQFQKSLEPEPPESKRRFRVLESLLGQVFKSGNAPGPVPPGQDRPIQLSVQHQRNYEELRDEATISISPQDGVGGVSGKLEVTAHLLGDASRHQLGNLSLELRNASGEVVAQGLVASHDFEVASGETHVYHAATEIQADSIVRFKVKASGDR